MNDKAPHCRGWRRLAELIDEAEADGREVFRPLVDLSPAERKDLVTPDPAGDRRDG